MKKKIFFVKYLFRSIKVSFFFFKKKKTNENPMAISNAYLKLISKILCILYLPNTGTGDFRVFFVVVVICIILLFIFFFVEAKINLNVIKINFVINLFFFAS